jgi:hypothetical protein
MGLFKQLPKADRQATQLAYRVRFWPYQELSSAGRDLLVMQRKLYLRKSDILEGTSDDKVTFHYYDRQYQIVWAYNNMPTEEEWNKRSDDTLIACEFRSSPAIKEWAVVILSFELPSSRLIAHRQGEFNHE